MLGLQFLPLPLLIYSLTLTQLALAESSHPFIVGEVFNYQVKPGDYLIKIGARYGTDPYSLAQHNHLTYDGILLPGQMLVIDNRHLLPRYISNGLIINIPQRMLFYFRNGMLKAHYPVGLGKPNWPTPIGPFQVRSKETHKSWLVPLSIQEEMRREGLMVKTKIPPGPDNPLGEHWIGLSMLSVGIHGTIAPASVYHFQSHGCIRLHPDDVADLYEELPLQTSGEIVYAPILLAQHHQAIFLEVHPDIYHQFSNLQSELERLAHALQLSDQIDWDLAKQVMERQTGEIINVTRIQSRHD